MKIQANSTLYLTEISPANITYAEFWSAWTTNVCRGNDLTAEAAWQPRFQFGIVPPFPGLQHSECSAQRPSQACRDTFAGSSSSWAWQQKAWNNNWRRSK